MGVSCQQRGFPVAAAALGVLCTALPALAQTAPVLPGYWDSTENVIILGASHARKCLTADKIQSFVAAPSNSHYRCTYVSQRISAGQAAYRGGACYSHKGRKVLSNVSVDGRYTPESFHLAFHFEFMVSAGVGLPGTAVIDAHRVSAECPADPASEP